MSAKKVGLCLFDWYDFLGSRLRLRFLIKEQLLWSCRNFQNKRAHFQKIMVHFLRLRWYFFEDQGTHFLRSRGDFSRSSSRILLGILFTLGRAFYFLVPLFYSKIKTNLTNPLYIKAHSHSQPQPLTLNKKYSLTLLKIINTNILYKKGYRVFYGWVWLYISFILL